jgi:cation transport regulator ChaB
MPQDKTARGGDVPRTIQRSDEHARDIWSDTHDSAVATYGEGERAHRTAFSSLKHSYKKEGDHWVPKEHRGPSDEQAARGPTTPEKSTDEPAAKTGGGRVVDNGMTRDELYERAKQLEIHGRSKMDKEQLAMAVHDADAKR